MQPRDPATGGRGQHPASSSPTSSPRTSAGDAPAVEPAPIAELRDIVDGRATLDDSQRTKQPDWTHDAVDSGQWPADRLDDHRADA